MLQLTSDQWMHALAVYREARGESDAAMLGVACVIRTRMHAQGKTATEIVTQSGVVQRTGRRVWQFSSFDPSDVNSRVWPLPNDPAWLRCCDAVLSTKPDPTHAATHYESCAPGKLPNWADPTKITARLGAFRFYRGV